jgi:hypothetical protein
MEHAYADKGDARHQTNLDLLLQGREIKWYKGHYLKLNAIVVSFTSTNEHLKTFSLTSSMRCSSSSRPWATAMMAR